jgi:hypothetical protein
MSYESDLEFAKDLSRRAGEIIRAGIDVAVTEWKSDHTPVTDI